VHTSKKQKWRNKKSQTCNGHCENSADRGLFPGMDTFGCFVSCSGASLQPVPKKACLDHSAPADSDVEASSLAVFEVPFLMSLAVP
jgi:hypothetical protein